VAADVVFLRPLPLEECFRLAVVALLSPVGADRAPPVVPDNGRRAEAERPAAFPQPPADIDVITGDSELRVKAADCPKGVLAEPEVAAGDVLRFGV
jgi:hypothetical protein